MADSKVPSILELHKELNKGNLKPVYYLFGADSFSIDRTLKLIKSAVEPLITSDFDRETIYGENKSVADLLTVATSFPFGSQKKLIIFKEFEKVKDKKALQNYVLSPSDFTVLVLIHNGMITSFKSEPFTSLLDQNYIYEAKELKGKQLSSWLVSYAESAGKSLLDENAQLIIEMLGENRSLIESQLEKIFIYQKNEKEISTESIKLVLSSLKIFTIFDLQNAFALRDKQETIKILYNLLNNGIEITFIITMLTRFFTAIAKIGELQSQNLSDKAAARVIGVHPYYYKDYVHARKLYSEKNLIGVFRFLLKADILIKTTNADSKTIATVLAGEILSTN